MAIGLPVSVCSVTFWNFESGGKAAASTGAVGRKNTGLTAVTIAAAATNTPRRSAADLRFTELSPCREGFDDVLEPAGTVGVRAGWRPVQLPRRGSARS